MKEFIISKQNEGQRLDKYLLRIVGNGGSSFIFKMLRKKNFVLNDKKATGKEILIEGDSVKLYISDDTFDKFKTESRKNIELDTGYSSFNIENNIVYEDEDIILINKPANVLSQKADKNDISINEYIVDYLLRTNKIKKSDLLDYKPSVINRLDRNTTGLIIGCKNLKAAQHLSESLRDRSINKYYKCAVDGDFEKDGLYKGFLTKDKAANKVTISENKINDESNYIETEYKTIEKLGGYSIVEVHLITGKPHQIRAHLSYLGNPIIGDSKYGSKAVNMKYKVKSQLLHAYKIVFPEYDKKYGFEFSGMTYIIEPDFKLQV